MNIFLTFITIHTQSVKNNKYIYVLKGRRVYREENRYLIQQHCIKNDTPW